MKAPVDLVVGSPQWEEWEDSLVSLRALFAEKQGGRLSLTARELPDSLPFEFETEEDLSVVAHLSAQNAFDIVVMGESLLGSHVSFETIRSLSEASHTTPILVLGQTIPEFRHGVETGFLRIVNPPRLSSTALLREIRRTLEMHVLRNPPDGQQRRLACLCRIFDQMIETMPYAVAVTDEDGVICSLNQAACRFWDTPADKAVGDKLVNRASRDAAEITPVPIEWLGHLYYLNSIHQRAS